jgi:hypothetical protein
VIPIEAAALNRAVFPTPGFSDHDQDVFAGRGSIEKPPDQFELMLTSDKCVSGRRVI